MTAADEDVKSQVPTDSKPKMTLYIKHENHPAIVVKVRPATQFSKIFAVAEQRFNVQPGGFRFAFDGERIQPTQTPEEVGMEDEDTIDAHLPQIGGCF